MSVHKKKFNPIGPAVRSAIGNIIIQISTSYLYDTENLLIDWCINIPACDSAPGLDPKPPSKFKHALTNPAVLSTSRRDNLPKIENKCSKNGNTA